MQVFEQERGRKEVPAARQNHVAGRQPGTGSQTARVSWMGGDGGRFGIESGWNGSEAPTETARPLANSHVPALVTRAGTVC